MESNLNSNLTSNLTYKNEVKSILSAQFGSNYGFLIEVQSPMGIYYCPVIGYKSRDIALKKLRETLKS